MSQTSIERLKVYLAQLPPQSLASMTREYQLVAADKIVKIATPVPGGDTPRVLARIGPPHVVEDILPIGSVLKVRDALDAFGAKLPRYIRDFTDAQSAVVNGALNVPS